MIKNNTESLALKRNKSIDTTGIAEVYSREAAEPVIQLSVSYLVKLFLLITLLLAVLSVGMNIYYHTYNDLAYITSLFDLDSEQNIPTRFSSELMMISAMLFFIVYKVKAGAKDKFKYHWLFLAIIFLAMAADESIVLHEQTSQFLRGSVRGLHFAWVIPGTVFVIGFVLMYLRFFFSLETRWKKLFFISASLFISGAIIMEVIGSIYQMEAGQDNLTYSLITNLEELLEFSGIIMLIYSLGTYLLHLSPSLRIDIKK